MPEQVPEQKPPQKIRKSRGAPEVQENVGFNMTPMIDIVFQLIIFFMLITDMSQQEIERVAPPLARKVMEDKNKPKERLIVNVNEKGDVKFRGKLFRDIQVLKNHLAERASRYKDPKLPMLSDVSLMLRADARTPFENVQKVLQICGDNQVRIYKVEINAKQSAGE
jgi:biopolymer transport protein ExbD